MIIEIVNEDGGELLHTIAEKEVKTFLAALQYMDEINIRLGNGDYIYAAVSSKLYQLDYLVGTPERKLMIYVDLKDIR